MRVLPRGGLGAVFPLLIMLLLAMLTLWLARTSGLAGREGAALENMEPDYIVEKFTLIRLSDSGQPRYALSADKMIHMPADDTSLLTKPALRQIQSGQPEVRISADRGVITSGGEVAHLRDNVEVLRAAEVQKGGKIKSESMRVTTTYLRVVPDLDRADTPDRVRIEQGLSILNGTGMDFDNRYRRFQLHADIRASFQQSRGPASGK